MYRPPAFVVDDPAVVAGLIRDLALAQLVTTDGGGFLASSIPLLLDDATDPWVLHGHLARGNPQTGRHGTVGAADAGTPPLPTGPVPCLALFVGPHAYVSPSAYPSKAEHGRVVPTWNYVEVHVHGTLRRIDDPVAVLDHVSRLTGHHEAGRPAPWATSDAPGEYLEALARGIVAVEVVVDRVEAKAKLSQNRPVADRRGVEADLEARGGRAADVAALMRGPLGGAPDGG